MSNRTVAENIEIRNGQRFRACRQHEEKQTPPACIHERENAAVTIGVAHSIITITPRNTTERPRPVMSKVLSNACVMLHFNIKHRRGEAAYVPHLVVNDPVPIAERADLAPGAPGTVATGAQVLGVRGVPVVVAVSPPPQDRGRARTGGFGGIFA